MNIEQGHLSEQDLERYREGLMDPRELLSSDDHLSSCSECFTRLGEDPLVLAARAATGLFERYFAAWQTGERVDGAPYPFAQRVGPLWLVRHPSLKKLAASRPFQLFYWCLTIFVIL